MISINDLLDKVDTTTFTKNNYALLFMWYHVNVLGNRDCTMDELINYFSETGIKVSSRSYLISIVQSQVVDGFRYQSYRLERSTLKGFETKYRGLIPKGTSPQEEVRERLDISHTPFLSKEDIENSYKMGILYIAIHCLENSVRCLIRNTLRDALGDKWWDQASSKPMRDKVEDRRNQEAKKRWLTSRGADELNYLDWSDLVTLIRKYHTNFESFIPDIKFVELRLEELENLRNTIAHSGVLPDEETNRIELALKDWCKQVSIH